MIAFGLVVNLAPDTQLALLVDDIGTTSAAALAAVTCLWFSLPGSGPYNPTAARTRRGWRFVGLACASWAAGNAVWAVYELVLDRDAPFPSPADIGYLGFVPLALIGIVLLGPSFRTVGTFKRTMDVILITVGLGGVGWILVLSPVAASTEGVLEQGLSLAYPIGDLVMLAVTLSVITVTRGRGRALTLLPLGLIFFALADASFAYMTATGQYTSGDLTAWAWFGGFLLMALAAGPPPPPGRGRSRRAALVRGDRHQSPRPRRRGARGRSAGGRRLGLGRDHRPDPGGRRAQRGPPPGLVPPDHEPQPCAGREGPRAAGRAGADPPGHRRGPGPLRRTGPGRPHHGLERSRRSRVRLEGGGGAGPTHHRHRPRGQPGGLRASDGRVRRHR